jgi:O-antigen/teichoic acid export membrane protein
MLKKNLIANYLGQGWSGLMSLAFIPLYIKRLGIEAYGVIGLFAVLQAWLGLLDMGMTPALGREMGRFTGGGRAADSLRDLLRSIEVIAFSAAAVMAVCVALASRWLATSLLKSEALSSETVAHAFAIMGFVASLRFAEGVYRSSIVGLQRQVLFNVVNSVMATLRGVGAVSVLTWVSPTLDAFFLWQAVVSVATLAILGYVTYRSIPGTGRSPRFSLAEVVGIWRFAGGMLGISVLGLMLSQIDKIILSKLLPLSEYGRYTLAGTVSGALYMLVSPITSAFYPRLCELHARRDEASVARNYHKGAQLVSVVAGSGAIVLMLYSQTFLTLWTRDPVLADKTARLLSLLALGTLLNALMWMPYQTQLAYGWTKLTLYVNMVAVTIVVPAIWFVVPRHGASGAAFAWIGLNLGYCLISIQLMHRKVLPAEKWRWYSRDIFVPLFVALAIVGAIKAAYPSPATAVSQALVLGSAVLLAMFASSLFCANIRDDLFDLVRRLFVRLVRS